MRSIRCFGFAPSLSLQMLRESFGGAMSMSVKGAFVGVLCAGAFALGVPTTALAQDVELKVSVFTPPVNPLSMEMERAKKEIEAKTGGRLKLNVFHASQM